MRAALDTALAEFIAASRRWLTVERVQGGDAVRAAYADVAAGRVRPEIGVVASLSRPPT